MKIGLLGLGFMGQQHLESYAQLPDVTVVTRHSPGYSDPHHHEDRAELQQRMLADPSIDAIDICLPTPDHPAVATAALESGKHVFCEKPMALSVGGCSQMLAAAERTGRLLMIAHVLRFSAPYRELARAVREKTYGPITSLRLGRSSGVPGWGEWLLRPEASGGAILDLLVHDFDQALALFGAPEQALIRTPVPENGVDCRLLYAGGFNVEVSGGWFRDGREFSAGFEARFAEAELIFQGGTLFLQRPGASRETVETPSGDMYAEEIRYFVDVCRQRREPAACPPLASARAVELALAVRELARAGLSGPSLLRLAL